MILAALALAATTSDPRFFVAGHGRIALVNAHSGAKATVTYRRDDGSYDPDALAAIRRVMRSRDGAEGTIALRLVELLGRVYDLRGGVALTIQSGYRSPDYNETIRARGARAAGGSLHTEGLAADVVFPKKDLKAFWMRIRGLECCGAGYYQSEGFLHLDVGRPRFWEPATSKVEQNLSAGNARLFARTEFDRYRTGEPIMVTLHALTALPVAIARTATVAGSPVRVDGDGASRDDCIAVDERGVRLRIEGAVPVAREAITLRTCEPRLEKTPDEVVTNPIEVRAAD